MCTVDTRILAELHWLQREGALYRIITHTYTYRHADPHTHSHTHTHIHSHMLIHARTHTHTHTHADPHTVTQCDTHIWLSRSHDTHHMSTHTHTHTHTHTLSHSHMLICMIHTHMHHTQWLHTHTHFALHVTIINPSTTHSASAGLCIWRWWLQWYMCLTTPLYWLASTASPPQHAAIYTSSLGTSRL